RVPPDCRPACTRTAALGVAALAAGAVDVLPATTSPEALVQSLKLMGDLRVVGRRARPGEPASPPRHKAPAAEHGPGPRLVAIGASTGGPVALVELLSGLPAGFPAAVLVVQHMPDDYGPQLAAWLGGVLALEVKLAAAGDLAHPGTVYLADGGHNLLVGPGGFLHTRPRSNTTGPCPSADVLFDSVARLSGFARCGVLLTGMGRDGAAGLLAIREAGGFTLVQDRASSVVSSMPDEAMRLGAAEVALPPAALAGQLLLWAGSQRL
ncbi:MAG: CheB methylesterase domain-containing protein, partial [Myxococcaceae bacterium]